MDKEEKELLNNMHNTFFKNIFKDKQIVVERSLTIEMESPVTIKYILKAEIGN